MGSEPWVRLWVVGTREKLATHPHNPTHNSSLMPLRSISLYILGIPPDLISWMLLISCVFCPLPIKS
jgi:hypothetical protein